MATENANGLAFRISNIPKEITGDKLRQILNYLNLDIAFGDDIGNNQNVLGMSLAASAASADAARYLTATVTFKLLPTEFQFAGASNSLHLLPKYPPVKVDKHFYGFTPLATPEKPLIDIIAVTGLAGHAFATWKARGGCAMWLRDFLPEHVPGARILTYGYDSTLLGNNSTASFREFSCNLLGDLNNVRAGEDALTDAAQRSDHTSAIFLSCYALLLFGMPDLGLEIASLRSLAKDQPNSSLIADLNASSAFLRRHKFFWDLKKAEGTREISETVRREVMMVSRNSAISATPEGNAVDIFSIDANHSDIVKFKTNTSQSYLNVRTRIMALASEAPAVISKRFEELSESAGLKEPQEPQDNPPPQDARPASNVRQTHRSCHLSDQAKAMAAGYAETGFLSDLQRAIRLAVEAAEATPANHPHCARHIAHVAGHWKEFYNRTGAVEHLDRAVAYLRVALAVAMEEDPERRVYSRTLTCCVAIKSALGSNAE
ncbi:hypothetical protein Q9L58_008314 [Maublancomyces gigas]|uniref:Uncharacterized protein n=1 Tax=Discina gigas TaxID=1032678 RepID=A0ABR3GAF6_9PEZI